MRKRLKNYLFGAAAVLLGALIVGLVVLGLSKPRGAPVTVLLADGRMLQIEGVTFGTEHRMGAPALVIDRLGPWLPSGLRDFFWPKRPESKIHLERPGLVVWVNALDPISVTNVDCQGIRVELEDRHGDLFGEDTRYWSGFSEFWRVGHVFYSFPRDEALLTLRITPWRTNQTRTVTVPNPQLTPPAKWSGAPPPQTKTAGPLAVTLKGLTVRTNADAGKYWATPFRFLEPAWECQQQGQPAAGWAEPEWIAEDATGNRGQHLGVHRPVLRFFATVYPEATNTEAAWLIAALPRTDLTTLTSNLWWNQSLPAGTNQIVALGFCPPGTHVFSEGKFDPNGPPMGPVGGGAPSGWVGQSQWINPLRHKEWSGHYTPSPSLYLRADRLGQRDRLAVRLRDEAGRLWVAKPESQGGPDGIHAFLVELPSDVTNVVPEVVLLRPVEADFLVGTKSTSAAPR